MIDFGTYERLLLNHPFKFGPDEVGYRKSDSDYTCANCAHFYTRKLDGFTVCEIMRPSEEEIESVDPRWVCDFQNDGDEYPFQEE